MKFVYSFVLAVVLLVCGTEVGQARFAMEEPPQSGTLRHCVALSFPKGSITLYNCSCYSLDAWDPAQYGPFQGHCFGGVVGWVNYGCNWVPVGGNCAY